MKQLFLNDLSLVPLAADFSIAHQRIHRLIRTYKARPTDVFDSRICYDRYLGDIQLAPELNLQTFCKDPRGRTLGSLLLGLGKYPYIVPDSPQEDLFIKSNYFISKDKHEILSYGLSAAFLNGSIAISFASEDFWNNINITLIENSNSTITNHTVLSVSSPEHFESDDFLYWRNDTTEIELIACDILPVDKRIHLRDDHGKSELLSFSRRLIQSQYIVEIVNSLPFNPQQRTFIKNVKSNGLIELVLTSTDQGLGLVVKTTGRNYRETERISSILKDEFD
jgi:hypothetical protein